jgi:hypothetical protein
MSQRILEVALIAGLALLFWGIVGWPGMPTVRGRQPRLTHRNIKIRYAVRSLLIVMTLVAILLGVLYIACGVAV